MKSTIIAILSIFFVAGCSYHEIVVSPQDFNHNVEKHSADIILKNGACYEARWIVAENDTLAFISFANDTIRHLPVGAVRFVKTTNHWGGALRGLFLGSLGGGPITYFLVGTRKDFGSDTDNDEVNRVIATAAVAIVCGTGASIYGGIHGDQTYYHFTSGHANKSKEKSVAP
jgi:hypothetical protein